MNAPSLVDWARTAAKTSEIASVERNELHLGQAVASLIYPRARFDTTSKQWLAWDGVRWTRANGDLLVRAAYQLMIGLLPTTAEDSHLYGTRRIQVWSRKKLTKEREAQLVAKGKAQPAPSGKGVVSVETGQPIEWEKKDETEWASTEARMSSAVSMARTIERVPVYDPTMWDAHPLRLTTPTGTVDLDTGRATPPRPSHMITKLAGARYEPEATAPEFEKFVGEVLPDPEVRRYVQQVLGSALYGRVREHRLVVFIGTGRNGKSTLLDVVSAAFGEYATALPGQVLVERYGDAHPTELMGLRGARLATSVETKAGQRWNVPLLKMLTGGDPITARWMRADFETWIPSHQLVIASNHRPTVSPGESAYWARYREVPFTQRFEGARADHGLKDRIIDHELPGVLNWLIAGWQDYHGHGLVEPASVTEASLDAAATSSSFAVFLREGFDEGGDVTVRDLYDAWRGYKKDETDLAMERPNHLKDVGRLVTEELPAVTYVKKQGGGRNAMLLGIHLNDQGRDWQKHRDPLYLGR